MELPQFQIKLPIGAQWRNIELIRSAILNCVAVLFADGELDQSVGMVVGELLENAIKYGDWEHGGTRSVTLRVTGNEHKVWVEVSNPVAGEHQSVRTFFEVIQRLTSYSSPQEAYEASLQRVITAENAATQSRLGLARIIYEANAKLAAECLDGVLCVHAEVPAKLASSVKA
jgi:hypothetical protein